ncbi:MAG TPA: CehA/McbA family metallohydrolase, partial [Candidatus Mediterraneibacter tabaqchaliae]|nr:CehA/McbA family metallohydrolase [Candidatus Mediterraneibacter tabaqchaliae]
EQAFQHAADVPNLDFLALTDHSNSFEGQSGLPSAGTTHLGDENAEEVNASWAEGREGARAITAQEGDFVGIYGFEMTWSGGAPGHINTFNSEGFENRNAAPYKKGDNYEVLEAYYDTLNANPETISQFNHPGDTFGDFMDFALYDPVTDNQITLIEVGNGEGAIGSSGYFPSYSYYTRALDKGWHVAPTNNQDNHKGNWGDSNTARSVVLSDGLSEEAIYDGMKNYRVYATEDNDLSILYSLNGNAMGSILDEQEKIHITAEISDPTDTAGETKVEVIVNGGQTLAEKTFSGGSATVEFDNLSTGYGYYYLRVTQTDKNIAVTAPVWTGESVNAGISNTSSDVAMPIKGDEIQISSQIFNNLSDDMTVTSLTYTMEGQTEPFHTADAAAIGENGVIGARASYEYSFPYTAEQAGGFNINAELKATIGGEEYTFTDVLKLSVSDPSIATKVLVDGTHYNDYVNGYYSGNMTNFINMGTSDNIQVKIVQPGEEVTADMLEDVALFMISAPLKYTSDYTGDAQPSTFEDSFIQVVSDYVNGGGTVVVCGLADYQDANSGLPYTSYAQANALLEGIGSTMRINDDELIDQDENGGQPYRLYFDDFNYESTDPAVQSILAGVKESGLAYSSYSGCSVSVGEGEAIVYGHDTTYSINSKAPAQGHDKPVLSYSAEYDPNTAVVQKGDVVSMATETVGEGRVYACGTVFCSNFEVAAEDQVSYANGIMAQNLLSSVKAEPVISTIQEARAGADGEVFTVVGTVANGTAESGNAFFNTIYIQDEEGNGINVFPIDDSNIRRGDQVQVTGSVSGYIGDKQLSAINVTVLEGNKDVVITDTTTKEANDYETNFGKLVRVKGEATAVTMAGGIVESITVQDDSGEACRVFIDGYITYSDEASQALEEFVKEGAYISAVGFVSHDAEGNRLRVRDRSEILPAEEGEEPAPGGDQPGSETDRPGSGQQDGNTQTDGSQTGNGAQQAGAAVKDPVSAAQTGDNASVGVWIAIAVTAVLAAGAAAVVIVVGKRRRQRES